MFFMLIRLEEVETRWNPWADTVRERSLYAPQMTPSQRSRSNPRNKTFDPNNPVENCPSFHLSAPAMCSSVHKPAAGRRSRIGDRRRDQLDFAQGAVKVAGNLPASFAFRAEFFDGSPQSIEISSRRDLAGQLPNVPTAGLQLLQFRDSLIGLPHQGLDDGDSRVQVGLQFALQVEQGDLPTLGFRRRVTKRDRQLDRVLNLPDRRVGFATGANDGFATTNGPSRQHPPEHDEAGQQKQLSPID